MQPAIILAALLLIAVPVFYLGVVRPWQLRWGATDAETRRAMPGDEIVSHPSFNATRAVTIEAPAENIYPWIAQIGLNRAGWYSYDVLDNLGRRSAERILTQFQNPQRGDLVPMSPDGKHGIWIKDFVPNAWMLWWDKIGDTSWAWGLYPEEGAARCRLITRVRTKYRWLSAAAPFNLLVEFFDLPMMRKCMLGIKRRAEALPLPRSAAGENTPRVEEGEAA